MISYLSIDRSIRDNFTQRIRKYMADQTKQWWEGLGKELETDIEAFDESIS